MSCSELLESLADIVSTNRHYMNSWIAQRSMTLTEQEFHELQVTCPDIYYTLLNILLYDSTSSLMFVPYGTKCTFGILKKEIPDLEIIICEVSTRFNPDYYHNLKEQFPTECDRFNITKEIMDAQKRIYGYFVWCNSVPKEKYSHISHAFTNLNTVASLHLPGKRKTEELEQLVDKGRSPRICITGSVVDFLLGKKSADQQTSHELLTYDEEEQKWNTTLLSENKAPFVDMAILVNCEKTVDFRCKGGKIRWGHETILVPKQTIKACQVPLQVVNTPLDLLHKETLLVYYKGVKFLCMSPEISSILASSPPSQLSFMTKKPLNVRIFRCRSPSLPEMPDNIRQPMWKENITRVYQTPLSGQIKIYPNCFLTNHATTNNSIWILRKNGSFDLVFGDFYFIPWILTSSCIAFGTISRRFSTLTVTYLGGDNNVPITKYCLNHNTDQKEKLSTNFITEITKRNKKSRRIKKISSNIQDERPERNSVSILSALLQRN